jgi:hypothetical protein
MYPSTILIHRKTERAICQFTYLKAKLTYFSFWSWENKKANKYELCNFIMTVMAGSNGILCKSISVNYIYLFLSIN